MPQIQVWAFRISRQVHEILDLPWPQASDVVIVLLTGSPLTLQLWMFHPRVLSDNLDLRIPLLPEREQVPQVEAHAEAAATSLTVADEEALELPLACVRIHFRAAPLHNNRPSHQ